MKVYVSEIIVCYSKFRNVSIDSLFVRKLKIVVPNYAGLSNEKYRKRITYNVHGLLLCWHFLIVSTELKLIKIAGDEVSNKCRNEFRPPDIS
jgi:hypothetical protein